MKIIDYTKKNKLIFTGGLYLFGDLFNKIIVFVSIPIFTRLLSTYEFGIFNTYNSWVSVMTVVIGLSLGTTIRNAFVDYHDELDKYISSITFLSLISFFILLLLITLIVFFLQK